MTDGHGNAPARVLIMMQRGWAMKFGDPISRHLDSEGILLGCLTIKKSTHAWVKQHCDTLFQSIYSYEDVLDNPDSVIRGREISLDEIAQDLGVPDIFWYFYERNIDRSYDPKRYYSYRPNMSDDNYDTYVKAVYWLALDILEEFNPTLIVGPNIVGPIHYVLYLLAKRRGINFTYASETKIRGVYFFTNTPNVEDGSFFAELEAQRKLHESRPLAKEWIEKERNQMMRGGASQADSRAIPALTDALDTTRRALRRIAKHHLSKTKGVDKVAHIRHSIDDIDVFGIVTQSVNDLVNRRGALSIKYRDVPNDRAFAFFPLQFQPEQSIDNASRYYSNQLETLRLTAMSLPNGMKLVVKEHPQMIGKNSRKYYEKIASLRNVSLVNPHQSSTRLIEKAACVVAPVGTVLFEAALLRRPAVQLGDYGLTKCLPNVIWCDHFRNMPACILQSMEIDFSSQSYEEGMESYVQAALNIGFRSNYFDAWEGGATPDEEFVNQYVSEVRRQLSNLRVSPSLNRAVSS